MGAKCPDSLVFNNIVKGKHYLKRKEMICKESCHMNALHFCKD